MADPPLGWRGPFSSLVCTKYTPGMHCEDGMSTRSRVSEGLQRERGVTRSLQRGVRRSLQEEIAGYWLVQNNAVVEETAEVLGERDYCSIGGFDY